MDNVYLAPDGGGDTAAFCDRAAAELSARSHTVSALADGLSGGWLGDCEEGRGWARLLQDKSVGTNSLRWLLECHAANLHTIAEQFRRSVGAYGAADREVLGSQWQRG